MSHDDQIAVTGVFAHRFVVKTAKGATLANLGPKEAERIRLGTGERVELHGEIKPSELKVHTIVRGGAQPVAIDHPKKPRQQEHDEADPKPALKTAEAKGFTVLGRPRRKPKHLEILGRDSGGDLVELHVELGGELRKTEPVDDADPKWAVEINSATQEIIAHSSVSA